jgi:hypothetical protein
MLVREAVRDTDDVACFDHAHFPWLLLNSIPTALDVAPFLTAMIPYIYVLYFCYPVLVHFLPAPRPSLSC